ncbi:MAG: nickel pincer cofactor biosynthesis protein LarB [Acidobacteriota bacterium]
MFKNKVKKLLEELKEGRIDIEDAYEALQFLPYEDIEFAKIDFHREIRRGVPEVILGIGKTDDQIYKIAKKIMKNGGNLIITKLDEKMYKKIKKKIPYLKYNKLASIAYYDKNQVEKGKGKILILSAGTSDIPVAEEAYVTCKLMGNDVEKVYDVGVAGIHRLFDQIERMREARVIIVVAGMEGALPSVVAGFVHSPVIAVPTSQGYGANFGGISPLLTMLNNCSGGIAVVNINNGFGAGYFASLINHL